jgi:hypothetical protein
MPGGSDANTPASAHVTNVVGCVDLDLKSIRIEEFERFLGCRVREFQPRSRSLARISSALK